MSKELKRARAMTLFTTAALLISFFAYFNINGSVAWFANNTEVSASGMSVECASEDIEIISAECYNVKAINTDEGNTYYVYGTDKRDLPIYDPQGISSSTYENAVVLVLEYRVNTSGLNVSIGASCPLSSTLTPDNIRQDTPDLHISDVVTFRTAEKRDPAVERVIPSGTVQSFVSLSEGILSKEYSLNNFNLSGEIGSNTAYFIIEYNEDILRYICNERLAKPGEVEYESDITLTISAERTNS